MSTPTRDAKETNLISGGIVGDIRLAREATELARDIGVTHRACTSFQLHQLGETSCSGDASILISLANRMLSNEQTMADEKIEQGQEIWSAIRYLDPDEADKGRVETDRLSKIATVVTLFVFAIIMSVWVMLCFRGL